MGDMPELKPCPFCGVPPRVRLGKKGHCQMHGDPFQPVVIECDYSQCNRVVMVSAGDIFNGGEQSARLEAITAWNTRAIDAIRAEARAEALREAASLVNRGHFCRSCGESFLSQDGHTDDDCTEGYADWDVLIGDRLAKAILALIDTPADPVREAALTAADELAEALDDLRKSAALLQQNSEGCAVNHYGEDFDIHGMPGWLADTASSISHAHVALTAYRKARALAEND